MIRTQRFVAGAVDAVRESVKVYLALLKILVPALVVVKLLQETGAVEVISDLMAPMMSAVGLPPLLSIVWATTLFTNIYTGMVVFFTVAAAETLTVAQVTILGALMLISHSIIVEGAVAKRIGVAWWITLITRVLGAYLFAFLLYLMFTHLDLLQSENVLLWKPEVVEDSLVGWAIAQLKAIVMIFFIILFLVVLLRLVRLSGADKLLHWLMHPVLRTIGIRRGEVTRSLSEMTMVGATLGLTFGAGLLIRQRDEGVISNRNARVAGSFIGVCHGLIDDTLLVLLLGANLGGVLFARIVFAVMLIALLTRVVDWCYGLRKLTEPEG